MEHLHQLIDKPHKLVIGLMGGTSADGIDAALLEIRGHGFDTAVRQLAFEMTPFPPDVRRRILALAGGETGGSRELLQMHFLLGRLYAHACLRLCEHAGIPASLIDLVGSHGQTVFHIPQPQPYLGESISGTLQIGEASIIAQALGCVVVSDFRVRDMAAGGQGAPLVPYTEFLLYRDPRRTVALQNLGGIGNITVIPPNCTLDEVYAFDTGPANVLIDGAVTHFTHGRLQYDDQGSMAAGGNTSAALLDELMQDEYLAKQPPKTTGREAYNQQYLNRVLQSAQGLGLSPADTVRTLTRFTAEAIRVGVERFCPHAIQRLILAGGGSHNPVLVQEIQNCLPQTEVLRGEDLGMDSDAKEAAAFAILANETIHGIPNNVRGATGAAHPVVMGKISQ